MFRYNIRRHTEDESAPRTFQKLADAALISVHGDHRWVRSFFSHKRLLTQRQPHVQGGGSDELEWLKSRSPVFILKLGILGHGDFFTHFEDLLLSEAWWDKMHNPDYDVDCHHVAKQACCRQVEQHLLHKHACSLMVESRFSQRLSLQTVIRLLNMSVTAHSAHVW